jgi:hypothetical protein
MISPIIMKEGTPLKGRTGLERVFKIKEFNINKI